ncbi:MAG: hypothetical protein ACHQDD_06075 [Steroidobacterales bacterium]
MISDEQAELLLSQRAQNARKQRRGLRSPYLLAGLLRCTCAANFDGDAGALQMSSALWQSGRQERNRGARLSFTRCSRNILTIHTLDYIRDQLVRLKLKTSASRQGRVEGIKVRLKKIDRQISNLTALLTEVAHQRPSLSKIDELESQRVVLAA